MNNYKYCSTWRLRDKNSYCRFHCNEINDLQQLNNIIPKEVIISGLRQKEFEIFCDKYADNFQIIQLIHCNLIKDFSPFENLENVQFISIEWNNKAEKLWNMTKNISLKGVFLSAVTKISNLNGIETALFLTDFSIHSGGLERKFSLDTLAPLSLCKSLKSIYIGIEEIKDNSIEPVMNIKLLEELILNTKIFETEQFAMLVAKLKNVKISPDVPYYIYNKNDVGNNNVLVVGKNKRFISETNPKLKEYEAEWNSFLNKYK